jgi:curved DNA-binding protein CbpA
MSNKKSLYELLQVPNTASYAEVRSAYDSSLKALQEQQTSLDRDDFTMQLRLLKVAYSTLSSPQTRDAYDAQLHVRSALQTVPDPVVNSGANSGSNPGAAAIHAEALMLRADAMALRADALGLKAQALGAGALRSGDTLVSSGGRFKSYLRYGLLTLGTLAAISMVLKVVFLFSTGHNPDAAPVSPAAAEKVYLQEYYQTYGVRPANRAEADRLDAERAKVQEAQRAQRQFEDEQRKSANAASRFEEESRRRGEQVSMELQIADERARQAQQLEERQKEEAQRQAAEAERQRIAQQQAKWQRVLGTSNSN